MLKVNVLLALLMFAPAADAEQSFREATEAVASGNLESALDHFEAALTADPDNLKYGSEYRQAVIKLKAYDRCIAFFEKLVADHPQASNAYLNFGFAYVDKIPDAGAITQVINANTALSYFTKSVELKPTWIGLYTRGNSYLFWPKIFNRTQLGIDDLEAAVKLGESLGRQPYHVRAWVSLGDGYFKNEEPDKAREAWKNGLAKFPGNPDLEKRLAASDEELMSIVKVAYDPNVRVSTNLSEVWSD
jgi:tetratricopeptide (TPR) repeat protein